MRLISIEAAAAEARRTLLRFPLVMLSAGVAAVVSWMLIRDAGSRPLVALLIVASLGLSLCVATTLTAERLAGRGARLALHGAALAALVLIELLWPGWTSPVQERRVAQLAIGFHLLVAFLPYLGRPEPHGFWQFNRALFLRFLTAALYSAVLFIGLSVALLAIDKLFGIRVSSKAYLTLWTAIAYLFNTWFFLSGVPADLPALEHRRDYPRALKVFSQFILIPLVAIYLAILTSYLVRVLVTGVWPSGWIGYLVSGVAAIGILSLLLVHPIRDLDENRWVATYARWFYVALLPAIGMLIASIWKRIAQYGVTEDRYFIAILALWLAGVAFLFIVRRASDVRWIPITLCAIAFASTCGPWGAYTISRQSQLDHLRGLLARHDLWTTAGVRPATAPVPFEARRELSSTLEYLFGTHGASAVRPVLGEAAGLDSARAGRSRDRGDVRASQAMERLGLAYVNRWEGPRSSQFSFGPTPSSSSGIPLAGLDYHVRLEGGIPHAFEVGGTGWLLSVDGRRRRLVLERSTIPRLALPLDSLIAMGRQPSPPGASIAPIRLSGAAPGVRALLIPRHVSGTISADTLATLYLNGDLYLGFSPNER